MAVTNNNPEIVISSYTEKDHPELQIFFKEVWCPPSYKKASAWFDWQLKDNPHADSTTSTLLLAKSSNKIVGMLILVPTLLWLNGHEYIVAWGRDLFVDPDFRRHKIALHLNEKWVEGIAAALGSGQSETMRILQQKHGWIELSKINQYEKLYFNKGVLFKSISDGIAKLSKRALAMLYAQINTPAKLTSSLFTIRHSSQFSEEVEGFWLACRQEYSNICSRDLRTLNWRFSIHPYYQYLISEIFDKNNKYLGYLVTRHEGDTCWIIDQLAYKNDNAIRTLLITEVERYYRKKGVFRFVSRSLCSYLESSLKSIGYVKTQYEQYACIKLSEESSIMNTSEWYITAMDSDLDR